MPLSQTERAAGRDFRRHMQNRLSELPEPDIRVPALIRHYRHECPGYRNGTSVSFDIAEQYVLSPEYPEHGVPAGRFAFIYHEGKCARCGLTARSDSAHRVVDPQERPPSGRVRQA